MNEETKELAKTLLEGFAKSINNLAQNFATKDDLEKFETRIKLEVKEDLKGFATKEDIKVEMQKQTEMILKVLSKYEQLTEKHEKLYQSVKKGFDE